MPAPKPRIRRQAGSSPIPLAGPGMVAAARTPRPAYEPLRLTRPAPGVLPNGVGIAMDEESVNALYDYAFEQSGYGSLWSYADRPVFLGFSALSELAQIPEYRRMTDTLAQEMTRKWIRITSSSGDGNQDRVKALETAQQKFGLASVFRQAFKHDGMFGRGQIYPDLGETSSEELKAPLVLSPRKIRKGSLLGFNVIEAMWSYPGFYNSTNALRADYYKPQTWYVMGQEVHRTRLITLISREVPDMLKPSYMFAGISLTQLARRYVENWTRTQQSVVELLESFTIWNLQTNLQALAQDTMGALETRFEAFNRIVKNRSLAVTDKDTEALANVSAPLGGLHELQAQAQEHQASVDGFPLLKLFGIQPSGLNASSEGELKCWYDRVHAQQEHFNPHVKTCLDIIQLSEFGDIDPDISFEWEPLWEPTAAERATIRKTEADTASVYIDKGVISPDEERERLALEDQSAYSGLDLNREIEAPGEPDAGGDAPVETDAVSGFPGAHDDAEFNESDHPRDADGKFGHGGGVSSSSGKAPPAKSLLTAAVVSPTGERTAPGGGPLPAHVVALKLPPAWTDVHYSDDPKSPLQAIGRDSKGREQRVYTKEFAASQAAAKFARIKELDREFSGVEAQNHAARQSDNPRTKAAADCAALVMSMGVRPGSEDDTQAKVRAYGATTLEGRHVVIAPDGAVSLQFTGKKGVALNLPVTDPDIARMLTDRKAAAGDNGQLFGVNEKQLLDHVHSLDGGGFKTKDFRTLLGTRTAMQEIAKMPAPKTEKDYVKAVKAVATIVSKKLGNTPTVALQSYISPAVFGDWEAGYARSAA